ncbi:unnamed protein product [Microthlaspi erraticum]|uniref:Arabidopsis retrotransposon Orf1 C-terminal domain-containing protein n=1 Tax=Microthlaspi erraticum TaxID=1685480 RepID=A0A6D2I1V6_9BRAS|nr:unnamed protein product [Microthlaspi erraticum]
MEEVEPQEEEGRTPHVPRALQCSLLHGLCGTKYPHVDTMKALGIFEDVELVLKNMHLAKLFSHTWNPTRSSLASSCFNEAAWRSCLGSTMEKVSGTSRKRNSKGFGLQSLMECTLPQGPRLLKSGAQCLRYVHKALANTFFARKAPGHQRGGTQTQPTTLINRKKLSVGGLITPILCAAGVNPTDREPLNQVGWTSSFARPTSSLSTRSWMGEEPELDRAEDRAESQAEDRVQESADLGEPECYYFEEYEAPRMNPSVVAAHKRIGLLQKFNKWQGKAIEKMQKSMDKMVSKIKSLEKKVSGSSSKKKKAPMSSTFLGVDHFSPLQGGSLPKSLTEPLLSSQGKEKTTRREGGRLLRPDAPARPPDSIESKQRKLNSIELTVELTEEPSLRIRI